MKKWSCTRRRHRQRCWEFVVGFGLTLLSMCCKQNHMNSAVEITHFFLPLPAAPPLTWILQGVCCCCERRESPTSLSMCERKSAEKVWTKFYGDHPWDKTALVDVCNKFEPIASMFLRYHVHRPKNVLCEATPAMTLNCQILISSFLSPTERF